MADFSRFTNWTPDTSFSEIVFAKDSPLLEVEMNEMQEINKANTSKITEAIGEGFYPTDITNYISYTSISSMVYDFTLGEGDAMTSTGLFIHVKNNPTLRITNFFSGKRYVYIKVWTDDATHESDIRAWGNVDGSLIVNPIEDNRYVNETSRRKVTKYQVEWGLSVPSNTSEYSYVNVGYFTLGSLSTLIWTKFSTLKDTAEDAAQQSLINKAEIAQLKTIGDRAAFLAGGYSGKDVYMDYTYLSDVDTRTDVKHVTAGVVNSNVVSAVYYTETGFDDTNFQYDYLLAANGYFDAGLYCNRKTLKDKTKYRIIISTRAGLGRATTNNGFSFADEAYYESKQTLDLTYYSNGNIINNIRIPINNTGVVRSHHGGASSCSHIGLEWGIWAIWAYDEDSNAWVECNIPDTVTTVSNQYALYPLYQVSPYPRVDTYTGGMCPVVEASVIKINRNVSGAPEFDAMFKDYNSLINKPSINSVTLQGNKTQQQLGIDVIDEMTEQEVITAFESVYTDEEEPEEEVEENPNE